MKDDRIWLEVVQSILGGETVERQDPILQRANRNGQEKEQLDMFMPTVWNGLCSLPWIWHPYSIFFLLSLVFAM